MIFIVELSITPLYFRGVIFPRGDYAGINEGVLVQFSEKISSRIPHNLFPRHLFL